MDEVFDEQGLKNQQEARRAEESRIKALLLEAFARDPEKLSLRRQELESKPLKYFSDYTTMAIEQLYEKVKHDSRAIKKEDRPNAHDSFIITFPPIDSIGSVTIQVFPVEWGAGAIRIYTGAASELLMADPDSKDVDLHHGPSVVVSSGPTGGSQGDIGMKISNSTLKDMQEVLNGMLLVEAMADQLTPVSDSDSATLSEETSL